MKQTNQPMPSGKANIQSANPPSHPEPDAPPIIPNLCQPQKQAKHKPREQQNKRGLQEYSLGLCKLFDGIEREDALRYSKGVRVLGDAVVGGDGGVRREENAGVAGKVLKIPNCTSTVASIVAEAVCWAAHSASQNGLWVLSESNKDGNFGFNSGVMDRMVHGFCWRQIKMKSLLGFVWFWTKWFVGF